MELWYTSIDPDKATFEIDLFAIFTFDIKLFKYWHKLSILYIVKILTFDVLVYYIPHLYQGLLNLNEEENVSLSGRGPDHENNSEYTLPDSLGH